MSDDLLTRATRALREQTAEPDLRSGLTRARVLDAAAKQRKKGWRRIRFIAPFVLTLGAGSALAQFTYQYFPAVWNAVVPAALERRVPDHTKRAARKHEPRRPARAHAARNSLSSAAGAGFAPTLSPTLTPNSDLTSAPTPTFALAPAPAPTRTPAPALAHARVPTRTPAPAPASPPTRTPASPPTPAPSLASADLTLFRRAMTLHDAKDPHAISAWDDFLRVAPSHPLAPEARYNRALALLRAGRLREARSALTPFARGELGTFRTREARELLDAIDASTRSSSTAASPPPTSAPPGRD